MYNRISNRRNGLSFAKYYFILVNSKTILNKINMQTDFDEILYIVEYFIVFFIFLVVFDWDTSKTKIISIHHV